MSCPEQFYHFNTKKNQTWQELCKTETCKQNRTDKKTPDCTAPNTVRQKIRELSSGTNVPVGQMSQWDKCTVAQMSSATNVRGKNVKWDSCPVGQMSCVEWKAEEQYSTQLLINNL